MWPVAPKMTHTFRLGGFWGPGGSQLEGSCSLDFEDAEGEANDASASSSMYLSCRGPYQRAMVVYFLDMMVVIEVEDVEIRALRQETGFALANAFNKIREYLPTSPKRKSSIYLMVCRLNSSDGSTLNDD